MPSATFVIVTVHNEAERIGATLAALELAFPGAPVWLADDGSTDATARIARLAGARVVASGRVIGKGGAATLAVREALGSGDVEQGGWGVCVFCDGDLGDSAAALGRLGEAVRSGEADVAVAVFAQKVGGGVGAAVGFARWAILRSCGVRTRAPISGQRALRAGTLNDVLPFAHGFGMEMGMTIDAVRAGHRLNEIELDLNHRATGRTPAGFAHRARQLADFIRAYLARR
jgi:glycosyltransferase involved in cell wall biosynthesis